MGDGAPCGGRGQGEGILRSPPSPSPPPPPPPPVSASTSRPTASLPSLGRLLPVAHPRCVPDVPRRLCPRALLGLVGGHLHGDEPSSRDALLVSPTLLSITTQTPLQRPKPGHGGLSGARSSHDEPRSGRIRPGSETWLRLLRVWTTRGLLGCGLTLDPLFKLPVSRP
ncbi:unnamed protein product [Urochloa humidicola]